jgi:hypothetical protein
MLNEMSPVRPDDRRWVLANTVVGNYHWDTTPVLVGIGPMMATLAGGSIRATEQMIAVIAVWPNAIAVRRYFSPLFLSYFTI